ncbi:MAG: alpha/beta hydrolase [Bacillaceae bacterium]|nr:alpha/beta hydrolase [Bacillaceae bacterium]
MDGKQLTFLFLHGAGGNADKWRKVREHLGKTPAMFPDLPGHGEFNGGVPASIEEYVALINQNIDEDTIVVGHSMGGLIALELASVSDKVKALVLVNSHYRLPVDPKIIKQLENGIFPENLFRASYAKSVSETLLEEERKDLLNTPVSLALADFMSCDRYDNGKRIFANLKIPVLAIYGEQDRLLPADAKERLLSVKSDVRHKTIADTGHYVPLENAEKFCSIIKCFRDEVARELN